MGKVMTTGKGRRWLRGGHPWLYSDDIAAAEGTAGELVPIFGPNDEALGWGLFSNASRIAVRRVTTRPEQPDRTFWAGLVKAAIERRARLGWLTERGACRLIGGDAEHLPGLVVDRYGDVLVMQSGCQGSDRMRDFLLELILEAVPFEVRAVLDRSDSGVRRFEDLEPRVEWLKGAPAEGQAGEPVIVEEDDLSYEVDVLGGHKTGHYLDQRDNRRRAAELTAARGGQARVLDAFSYDGLFGIRCALAGAREVVCLDQNAAAGERLMRNAERNGVADRVRFVKANAMTELRALEQAGERFDLVVCDPPAFARNRREAAGAARGYREVNLRAMRLLVREGVLVSASCSYNVSREEFIGHLEHASRDAGRDAWLIDVRSAAADHPVLLGLPESSYLKCAFLGVSDRS